MLQTSVIIVHSSKLYSDSIELAYTKIKIKKHSLRKKGKKGKKRKKEKRGRKSGKGEEGTKERVKAEKWRGKKRN